MPTNASIVRVLILGAGGHAQVVADILLRMRDAGAAVAPIGYLDDNVELTGRTLLDLPVFGGLDAASNIEHDAVIVAIGHNQTRQHIFEALLARDERFMVARHPSAIIAPDVQIGPGTMICAGAVVNPGSAIGANVILNTGCTVDHHNTIGDHAHIAPGVHLGGDVRIGSGTLVGIGATVIPQRSVGAWSAIGAGSVVTKNVADCMMAAGNPARVIRAIQEAGSR
jgi:sugar O-acyltransferase (sialic acid O-acetyltransferase NeuD family)